MSTPNPLYFASLRRMMIAYATVFQEMYLLRQGSDGSTEQLIKVPLEYGSKSYWYRKMEQREHEENNPSVRRNLVLPRMSFIMSGLSYDSTRKLNTMNFASNEVSQDMRAKQLGPVPYNLSIEHSVWSNNIEDLLMIVEQILPLFSPQLNLRIREIDDMNVWNDVDVIMEGDPTFEDNFDQGFEANRLITCTFNFQMRGHVYPPVRNNAIIHRTYAEFKNADTDPSRSLSEVLASANQTAPPDYDKDNSSITVTNLADET